MIIVCHVSVCLTQIGLAKLHSEGAETLVVTLTLDGHAFLNGCQSLSQFLQWRVAIRS